MLAKQPTDDPDGDDDEVSGEADGTAAVLCPYCGESNEIALDPSGGKVQDYVEDCQVCCQPWHVHVHWRRDGSADVRIATSDG